MLRNFDEYFKLNENLKLTDVELKDFIYDLHSADEDYTDILSKFFNLNKTYIEIEDAKNHLVKLNDIEGDILNNNRVIFKAIIFSEYDLSVIKNNIVKWCINKYYDSLPEVIEVLGIKLGPISFINKEQLKYTLDNNITQDSAIKTISELSGFNYNGINNGYFIWSKK